MTLSIPFLKSISIILAFLFATHCIINLVFSFEEMLTQKISRFIYINFAFQNIFLISTIPMVLGIIFRGNAAMVPFLVVLPCSMVFNVIGCIVVGINMVISSFDSLVLLVFFIIGCMIDLLAFLVGFLLWKKLVKAELETEENIFERYAFKRFENFVE